MGNQAEQIEDDRWVETKHETQAYDRPLPEAVVATSGDAEMNDSKQALKRNEKPSTNGVNPSPSEDEDFEGDPNLFVPQYEYPDGEDEAKPIDSVDGKGHQNLVVSQSNNIGGDGAKEHDQGNCGVPKKNKQPQNQIPIGLGEAQKPKKKKKAKSKRGVVSTLTRYLFLCFWLDECKRQLQADLRSTTLMCQHGRLSMKKRKASIMSKFWREDCWASC